MTGSLGAPGRPVTCPALIGRADLLAMLCRFLDGEADGGQAVTLVAGEAGLGKSRLVAEARSYAARRGIRVLEGACFPQDRMIPYAPLLDMLRTRFRDDGPGAVLGDVEAFAGALHPLLPDLVPRPDGPRATPLEPDHERGRLFAAIAHCLFGHAVAGDEGSGRTAGPPVVLTVDDLHWCDDASLDVLLYLIRHGGARALPGARHEDVRPRFLLLGTYRAEDADPRLRQWLAQLHRQRLVREVSLAPLGRADVAAMVAAMAPAVTPALAGEGRAPNLGLVDALYDLSEGNPFWVEELLTALSASGVASGVASGEVGAAPAGPDALRATARWRLPRSLHDAVSVRVAGLSAQARQLVTLAAVIGRRFNIELVQRLAGIDERTLFEALRELMRAQLVVETSPEQLAFRHALTRQVIYAELLHRERVALHRAVVAAAEQLASQAPGGDREELAPPDSAGCHDDSGYQDDPGYQDELAYHAYEAELWDKALRYARRAGLRAARLYAPRSAEQHLTRAIEAARRQGVEPPIDVVSARGHAFETLGEPEAACRDFASVLERARTTGDRHAEWQALVDLGAAWDARSYAMSGEYYRRALGVAREIAEREPRLLARTLNFLGNWHTNLEQTAEAIHAHEAALAAFRQLGDAAGIAETLDVLGMACYLGGDLIRAWEYQREAVERFRELGDRRRLSSALATLGGSSSGGHLQDLLVLPPVDPDDALRAAEASAEIAREIGWRAGEAYSLNCISTCCTVRGMYGRADEAARAALDIAEGIAHHEWVVYSLGSLAMLHLDILAFVAARRYAERAFALAQEIGSRYWTRFAAALTSRARALDGDLAGAEAVLAGLVDPDLPARTWAERAVWWAQAELALARGAPTTSLQIVDMLSGSAARATAARPIRRLTVLRGEALAALGRSDEAEAAFRAARSLAVERAALPLVWRLDVRLGQLHGRAGRRQQAAEAFESARALVAELAASLPDTDAGTDFLARASAALPGPRTPSARRAAREAFAGLTVRERDVAALVGQGLSNREIADALILGERTVQTHVSNIFAKLGVSTRAQVAVWAAGQGLMASAEPEPPSR